MQTILQDLRYAARMLRNRPGFTLVAVITLSLGIGANTAIFSVVNAVLLRRLPFKDPERLVSIYERRANSGEANLPISAHEFAAWQERTHSFEALTLIQPDGLTLTGRGDPVIVNVARVSTDFFAVIGVPPLLGRGFAPGEDQGGGAKLVVLGEKLWRQRFGADPNVINQSVTLNDEGYAVVGVMPTLELMPDVILPIDMRGEVQKVGKHSHQIIGRLKTGITIEQAQADLAVVSSQLEQEMVQANKGHLVHALPIHEDVTGDSSLALLTLFGAVGFVLLISCANVANLLLTRAAIRQKEMAIRTALGAGRWRLIRQTLTESLLLAAVGGGLGLLAAFWIVELIRKTTVIKVPRLDQIGLDNRVLLATVGFSLFTGLLTGIAPAWRSSEPRLYQGLIDGARGSVSSGRRRIGNALVVMEVSLAVILLVGGGLMLKSFVRLVRVDPGFDPHQVLRLDLALPGPKYSEPQKQRAFYEELLARLKNLPGVERVGATTLTPLSPGDNWSGFAIEGRPDPPEGDQQQAATRVVSNDYFQMLRIPLKKGRFFTDVDARVALPVMRYYDQQPYPAHFNDPQPIPTVIINEAMAKQYFPNEDPLGKRLRIIASPWLTVVGVVGDVHHTGLNTLPNPEIYLSHLQEPSGTLAVMIRTSGDPLQLSSAARQELKRLDRDLPVTITTMDHIFSDSIAGQRFNALLLGVFASLALVLAMVGVFGVINYSVAQRTHEIGIRLALGAQRRDVFKLVIGQGLVLALVGVLIGAACAFAMTRLITGLLYDVSPTDSSTFVFVSMLVTVVALLACWLPARRATKVDPLVALRYE
ncbi:MAG TPA: ABC transporter permease [Pyrinomonadaceae bacterium]|nr:ABC transporter permease [Pyrinomonadaceae bacterium]